MPSDHPGRTTISQPKQMDRSEESAKTGHAQIVSGRGQLRAKRHQRHQSSRRESPQDAPSLFRGAGALALPPGEAGWRGQSGCGSPPLGSRIRRASRGGTAVVCVIGRVCSVCAASSKVRRQESVGWHGCDWREGAGVFDGTEWISSN